MGIKKLSKYIKENNLYKTIDIKDLQYKKIAIDISILLYQICISIRNTGDDLRNNHGEITSHILGLFNKTVWLLSYDIIPIFIFDGKPPEFKKNTIKNRKEIRLKALEKLNNCSDEKDRIKYLKKSTNITRKQIQQSKELLDLMGIPYLQAEGEADILCARLSELDFVDYVFTEDMDILTFGAKKIIKNLFSKKPIEIIDKNFILQQFNLSHQQFIIFCIILGCDYIKIQLKPTLDQAIYLSKNYYFFNNITLNNKIIQMEDIINIYNYFEQKLFIDKEFKIILSYCDKQLYNILVDKYNLISKKISWKINLLNKKIKYLQKLNI